MKCVEKIVKILTDILMVIVAIIVFFALFNFFELNVLNKKYFNFFGYTFFDVVTGSMADTINVDDVILVKITDEYKVGDIITYNVADDFITHRIVKMDNDVIVTKGDANNTSDNPIDQSVVVGKVIKIIPRLGLWKKTLTTPRVFGSIMLTLFLFSLAFSYRSRDKKKEEVIEKKEKKKKIKKKIVKKDEKKVKPIKEKVEDISKIKSKKKLVVDDYVEVSENVCVKKEDLKKALAKDDDPFGKTEVLDLHFDKKDDGKK